jgi:dimeric dUTPase (all-alpha-NTP-PPase superfamily)
MDILKTIPLIPEKTDAVHKVIGFYVDLLQKNVVFTVLEGPAIPVQFSVPFSDVTALVTAPQKNTFVLVVRTALSVAMGVDISKIPLDIFAQ